MRLLGVGLLVIGFLILKYLAPSAGPPGAKKLRQMADRTGVGPGWDLYLFLRRCIIVAAGALCVIGGILYLLVPPAHLH